MDHTPLLLVFRNILTPQQKMAQQIPSWELRYPLLKGTFEDDFPFPMMGYVSSLKGINRSVEIITTSADVTPNGGLVRESPPKSP